MAATALWPRTQPCATDSLAFENRRLPLPAPFAKKGRLGGNTSQQRLRTLPSNGLSSTLKSPILAALCTFVAFVVCGLVPLETYLAAGGLVPCVVATGLAFFAIGAIRSRWSLIRWWRSGLETFFIGMSAAALAVAVSYSLILLVNVSVG